MVSIQVHESVAAALTAQASHQGLSLEAYLAQLARQGKTAGGYQLTPDEIDRTLDELSLDVPLLPADFSRADIY